MNKLNKSFITIVFAATLLLALFASIMLMLAFNTEYEPAIGYFKVGSLYSFMTYVSFVLAVVWGIVAWIINRREYADVKAFNNNLVSSISLCVLAAAILFATLTDVLLPNAENSIAYINVITLLSRLFGILASVSLVARAMAKDTSKTYVCVLSFFPPLYFAVKVLLDYFNHGVAVNSPSKIFIQLAFVLIALVLTSETALCLGRGQVLPRYFFTLITSSVFNFAIGLSSIVNGFMVYDVTTSVLCIVAGIYSLVSLYLTVDVNLQKVRDPYSKFFEEMKKRAEAKNDKPEEPTDTADSETADN